MFIILLTADAWGYCFASCRCMRSSYLASSFVLALACVLLIAQAPSPEPAVMEIQNEFLSLPKPLIAGYDVTRARREKGDPPYRPEAVRVRLTSAGSAFVQKYKAIAGSDQLFVCALCPLLDRADVSPEAFAVLITFTENTGMGEDIRDGMNDNKWMERLDSTKWYFERRLNEAGLSSQCGGVVASAEVREAIRRAAAGPIVVTTQPTESTSSDAPATQPAADD